jgi:hypothetical protein
MHIVVRKIIIFKLKVSFPKITYNLALIGKKSAGGGISALIYQQKGALDKREKRALASNTPKLNQQRAVTC